MAVIAVSLIIYVAGLHEAVNYLSYAVAITILCIGVKKWREQSGGFLTFGGVYKHLMIQSLVYSVVMAIWTYFFVGYIAPGMFEDQLLKAQVQMEDQNLPQESIDMAMKWTRWMMQPVVMAFLALIGGILMYAVVNLIIAAIMKKDPSPEQFMSPMDMSQSQNYPPHNFPPQQ